MKSLDKILELIQDSNWHAVEEIKKKISLPEEKLDKMLSFLQEQKYIDREHERLRITSIGLRFLELPA